MRIKECSQQNKFFLENVLKLGDVLILERNKKFTRDDNMNIHLCTSEIKGDKCVWLLLI